MDTQNPKEGDLWVTSLEMYRYKKSFFLRRVKRGPGKRCVRFTPAYCKWCRI